MSLFDLKADESKVLSQDLLDHFLGQFPLGSSIIHGEEHWMRVLYNGRMLAKETGANLNVVELFAIMHDCKRDNEDFDLATFGIGTSLAYAEITFKSGVLPDYESPQDDNFDGNYSIVLEAKESTGKSLHLYIDEI